MPTPDRIKQLVETFEQNIAEYRSSKNETELAAGDSRNVRSKITGYARFS